MLEWLHNDDITRYLQVGGKKATMESTQEFIKAASDESKNLHRAVVDQNDNYLGTVSLKNIDLHKKEAEYAIAMHPSALGTGASRTASQRIIELGFQSLGLTRIYLNVLESNLRAVRFYQKFGFQYTHTTDFSFHDKKEKLLWYEVNKK